MQFDQAKQVLTLLIRKQHHITIAVQFGNLNELLRNAKGAGARHNIDLSTSFSMLSYLNITPSINFEELWYLQS